MNARALLDLLHEEPELVEQLIDIGVLPPACGDTELTPETIDKARVAHTLVRELDVNWPGVEIILQMRAEILATRRQMVDLLALVESWRTAKNRS